MKKVVLLIAVLVFVVPASAAIFSDDFNTGWAGPDSLGLEPESRAPINWDRIASVPSNVFNKISMRGFGDNAMVLSIWGDSTCYVSAYNAAVIPAGSTALKINLETKGEGWGWHITGLVNGIFKDGLGNALGTVSVPLTDIANGVYLPTTSDWVAREVMMAVPAGAATVTFQLENRRETGVGQSGGIWFDNFVVTPEPMTVGLLGLGALFLRRRKA